MQDPTAHTPHRPSAPPTAPLPSPGHVPYRYLRASPAALPTSSNSAPTGSPAGPDPRSSSPFLHIPPLPLPDFAAPAPQTIHTYSAADTLPLSGSTPPGSPVVP